MFQIGDYIIYRNTGVCQVVQIGIPENFSILDSDVQYYFLEPLHGSGIIYIPVNSTVFMRPVISKEQAMELIASIPTIPEQPDYSKDQKALHEHYKTLLQSHDCTALIQLIKNIHKKSAVLTAKGKNAGKTDLQYKEQAETLLHEELSIALGIPVEEVPAYIRSQIENTSLA